MSGPCRLLADSGVAGRSAPPGPLKATVGTCRPARAPRCLRRRTRAPSRFLATPGPPRGREGSWPARRDLAGPLALSVLEGSGADLYEPGRVPLSHPEPGRLGLGVRSPPMPRTPPCSQAGEDSRRIMHILSGRRICKRLTSHTAFVPFIF